MEEDEPFEPPPNLVPPWYRSRATEPLSLILRSPAASIPLTGVAPPKPVQGYKARRSDLPRPHLEPPQGRYDDRPYGQDSVGRVTLRRSSVQAAPAICLAPSLPRRAGSPQP